MERNELSASISDSQVNKKEGGTKSSIVFHRLLSLCSALLRSLVYICAIALLTYISLVVLILYSKKFKMEIIFSNRISTPLFADLSDCNSFGLTKCENIFIHGDSGKIGAWLVSPSSKKYFSREVYILYLHGNMGSRGSAYRVELYKKLTMMGYHILTIDYRGFGDSEGFPTEEGIVEDSKAAYKWLAGQYPGFPLYIWGHSLGSAVAVQVAAQLNMEHFHLNGVILEAPFNNMTDGILMSPGMRPVLYLLPNIEGYISDVKNVFRSSYWIKKVITPIKILHDVSDDNIKIALGRRLFYSAKEVGSTSVDMVEFDEKLSHFYICNAKNLKSIMKNFIYSTSGRPTTVIPGGQGQWCQ